MWEDLFVAIALVLVIEGIMPFVSPSRWRKMVNIILEQTDRALRAMGFGSMLLGILLLYIIRFS